MISVAISSQESIELNNIDLLALVMGKKVSVKHSKAQRIPNVLLNPTRGLAHR
jgi:hypothetical protein